jgi:hypothetical protein
MTNKLGIFYSCFNEKEAVNNSIKELRKWYPEAPIYLVSDGGLDFSYLTKKYDNIFVSLDQDTMSNTFKVTDKNFKEDIHQEVIKTCAKAVIERLKQAIRFCKTEYILMMDPDALVRGKLTIPDGVKLLGSRVNQGFPDGLKNILSNVEGAKVIDCWGATPAIFESNTFLKATEKLTDDLLDRLTKEFYAIYAHDVLLPILFSLVGEDEVYNPDISECNRDYNWKENGKPLLHQYKEYYAKARVTLVTSLFNLSKLKRKDNRSWEDYLNWFKKTLSINCNFIIFTEPDVIPTIEEVRSDYNTLIIETSLEQAPYYYLKETIQNILDSDYYKSNIKDISRVECQESLYSVIQYSKFKWLEDASNINPFDSDFFFWVDAGISRFLDEKDYTEEFPSLDALSQLSFLDDTFLIQYNDDYYKDLTESRILPKSYFWDNHSFVCGSMFGGTKNSISQLDKEIEDILRIMIKNKSINNEQIALGYLTKIREDLFTLFYRTNPSKHLELFTELA